MPHYRGYQGRTQASDGLLSIGDRMSIYGDDDHPASPYQGRRVIIQRGSSKSPLDAHEEYLQAYEAYWSKGGRLAAPALVSLIAGGVSHYSQNYAADYGFILGQLGDASMALWTFAGAWVGKVALCHGPVQYLPRHPLAVEERCAILLTSLAVSAVFGVASFLGGLGVNSWYIEPKLTKLPKPAVEIIGGLPVVESLKVGGKTKLFDQKTPVVVSGPTSSPPPTRPQQVAPSSIPSIQKMEVGGKTIYFQVPSEQAKPSVR